MNVAGIYSDLQELTDKPFDPQAFVFDLLEIYDAPKATITKLRQGTSNYADRNDDLLWKNKLFFRVASDSVSDTFDAMVSDPLVARHHPRFIFATDGTYVFCRDQKTEQTLESTPLAKLSEHYLLFLPLAGIERYEAPSENVADIKATARVAKLYDAILEANSHWIERDYTHDLNQFMTRLLFCFFAEDTAIFEKDLFTSTVVNHTNEDGSDTAEVIQNLFDAMSTPPAARTGLPDYAMRFRYVNGGLFRDRTQVPRFSKRARRLLRECGELFWKDINPDIFGSMIQAVAQPDLRDDMGMHYTSVPNIMKVLLPLFLLPLEEEFEASKDSEARLSRLLQRIYRIRVFDPACGSGNFLIIAYKELRKLEMRIFERRNQIARQGSLPITEIKLSQFYGIELTDFATETAKLSLWIAEYQMNELFRANFGKAPPPLPLHESGNITHGNATRLNWLEVCPPSDGETFIVGNPPYLGRAGQTKDQMADMAAVFAGSRGSYKNLDYVACWYVKAGRYCAATGAQSALVTTNSVCQGEQVALLWPSILDQGLEIGFAYEPFKWRNSAAKNAAVTCVIVGLRPVARAAKYLYNDDFSRKVTNISPYLVEGDNRIVAKRRKPLSFEEGMNFGSMANDGGALILSRNEYAQLIRDYPESQRFLRRLFGSQEFSKGIERWCLWIGDDEVEMASQIPPIRSRIERVRTKRLASRRLATKALAEVPYRFAEVRHRDTDAILIPKNTSERRRYITAGLISAGGVVSDLAFAVYDAEPHVFAIVSSRLHYVWGAAIGGRFKMDPRYSNTLVYNTFPVPSLSRAQKDTLDEFAFQILAAREAHPGKTISWLYDPKTMPLDLAQAHADLDDALENMFAGRTFGSDAERLQHLFRLYGAFVNKASAKGPTERSRSNG